MSTWQRLTAKALLSVALLGTAFAKGKTLLIEGHWLRVPEALRDGTAVTVIILLEVALGLAVWTSWSALACWGIAAGAASAAYAPLVFDRSRHSSCGCLGSLLLSPGAHDALVGAVFGLAASLLVFRKGEGQPKE
jgi:hypothetical protein